MHCDLDSMVVVRGTTSKNLNTMLYDAVSAFDENNLLKKRIPPISVHLEHVFGFQVLYCQSFRSNILGL